MVNKYYYLLPSLPSLKFPERPPIDREYFISECEKWLTPGDLKQLVEADINETVIKENDPSIMKEWKRFVLDLREGLARIRRARKLSVPEKIPVFFKDIFDKETPLMMEEHLAGIRWDFIESMEFGYYFDINQLILYYLKLQLLERISLFEKEKGRLVFEKLCEESLWVDM